MLQTSPVSVLPELPESFVPDSAFLRIRKIDFLPRQADRNAGKAPLFWLIRRVEVSIPNFILIRSSRLTTTSLRRSSVGKSLCASKLLRRSIMLARRMKPPSSTTTRLPISLNKRFCSTPLLIRKLNGPERHLTSVMLSTLPLKAFRLRRST